MLLRRRRRPTRSTLLVPPIPPRVSPPPTLAVFALNCLPSATRPLTVRCPANTAPLAVAWSIRATDRWVTLPTTLTPLTRAVPCTSNVSKIQPPSPSCFSARIDPTGFLPFDPTHRHHNSPQDRSADLPRYGKSRDSIYQLPAIIYIIDFYAVARSLHLSFFSFRSCLSSNHDIPCSLT